VERLSRGVKIVIRRFGLLYLGLTLAAALTLIGLALFDVDDSLNVFNSVGLAMSSVSTGGFSPHAGSLADFSPATQWVVFVFMALAGTNIVLLFRGLMRREGRPFLRDSETRLYAVIALLGAVGIGAALSAGGVASGWHAIREDCSSRSPSSPPAASRFRISQPGRSPRPRSWLFGADRWLCFFALGLTEDPARTDHRQAAAPRGGADRSPGSRPAHTDQPAPARRAAVQGVIAFALIFFGLLALGVLALELDAARMDSNLNVSRHSPTPPRRSPTVARGSVRRPMGSFAPSVTYRSSRSRH